MKACWAFHSIFSALSASASLFQPNLYPTHGPLDIPHVLLSWYFFSSLSYPKFDSFFKAYILYTNGSHQWSPQESWAGGGGVAYGQTYFSNVKILKLLAGTLRNMIQSSGTMHLQEKKPTSLKNLLDKGSKNY